MKDCKTCSRCDLSHLVTWCQCPDEEHEKARYWIYAVDLIFGPVQDDGTCLVVEVVPPEDMGDCPAWTA